MKSLHAVVWAFSLPLLLGIGCSSPRDATLPVDLVVDPELVKNNNRFAFDLFAKVQSQPGNLFFSPASISTALAMTYAGARGETAEQMAKVCYFPPDEKRLHPKFAAILHGIRTNQAKNVEIRLANSLWLDNGFAPRPEFAESVKSFYDSVVGRVDFTHGSEAARETINEWVREETKGQIKDLVHPGELTPLTCLVLTNAIFFKGSWASQFLKEATREDRFYRKNGDAVEVSMMSQLAAFPYWEGDGFQVAELPYGGNQLSMVIFLPSGAEGVNELQKKLTPESIGDWREKMREQKINMFLPRFQAKLRLDLKVPLHEMGLLHAFDRKLADFSGIAKVNPAQNLFVAAVVHEAIAEINEEGTKASGATAVIVEKKSEKGSSAERPPPTFNANRPFIFLIRDNRTGSVLFIGRLADPTAAK